nr:hypothetical protein [Noviherbaspirillum sp. Root189]
MDIDDKAAILWRMQKSGAKDLSDYLRKACLNGGYDIDSRLGRMQREIDMVLGALEQQQKLLQQVLNMKADDVELKLLAGVYKMLHMSAGADVRMVMAQDLDYAAIDAFLNGGEKSDAAPIESIKEGKSVEVEPEQVAEPKVAPAPKDAASEVRKASSLLNAYLRGRGKPV